MRMKNLLRLVCGQHAQYYIKRLLYCRFPRYKDTKIEMDGISWHVPDVASFFSIWKELLCEEVYAFQTNEPHPVVLDFGANVGLSVYYFATRYPEAEIHAYEADPIIFEYLRENVAKFDNGRIFLYNLAVHDCSTKLTFAQEGADGGHIDYLQKEREGVQVETIDAALILNKFMRIAMLKIDVEGAERSVVPAISEQLKKVDNMFLEYHSEIDHRQCFRDIISRLEGFRIYIRPGFCPRQPLLKADSYAGFDLQLNLFAKRIHK